MKVGNIAYHCNQKDKVWELYCHDTYILCADFETVKEYKHVMMADDMTDANAFRCMCAEYILSQLERADNPNGAKALLLWLTD